MEKLKDIIQHAVYEKIEQEIEDILEKELNNAVITLKSRIKEMTGGIASQVASYVDYQHNNDRLVITISTKNLD